MGFLWSLCRSLKKGKKRGIEYVRVCIYFFKLSPRYRIYRKGKILGSKRRVLCVCISCLQGVLAIQTQPRSCLVLMKGGKKAELKGNEEEAYQSTVDTL